MALSAQYMAGFGNFRPEVYQQCIDFDPFYTVSYGTCFSGLPPGRGYTDSRTYFFHNSKASADMSLFQTHR